jgi:hypothetical protein
MNHDKATMMTGMKRDRRQRNDNTVTKERIEDNEREKSNDKN